MVAPQTLDRETELGNGAGFEILHEHVGLREHRLEQRLVGGLAEVEHGRFLAAIEPDEIGALAVRDLVVVARAPAAASRHVQVGADTACSIETTRTPSSGRVMR